MHTDIFKDKQLYPLDDDPVLAHFSGYFDRVYIALLPFFTLDGDKEAYDRAPRKIISLEEFQERNPILNKLDPDVNRVIYGANENYPSDQEIFGRGREVGWKRVLEGSGIGLLKTLNRVLMTSVGVLRTEFALPEVLDLLNAYTQKEGIYHPSEGSFDVLTRRRIFELLWKYGLEDVVVEDEFYDERKQLVLSKCGEAGFVDRIGGKDYYIYPSNKACLFTISWDYFFFFIGVNSRVMDPKDVEENFEGFWASEKDSHYWYH